MTRAPSLDDVQAAATRVAPHIRETPATWYGPLGLAFKWENQQLTGAYKPRGALNKILALPQAGVARGLVAASAGNHGQGVALAARLVGSTARVYVPEAAPAVKVDKMLALGAEVSRVPGYFDRAEARARADARDTGATFVSPYNDADVIAGAGTVGLAWLAQQPALTRWLVPLGGGGLLCGLGIVARALRPDLQVIGVQSEQSAYLYQQYTCGHMRDVVEGPTLTDGLAGDVEDGLTTALIREVCDGVLLVREDEVAAAVAYAWHHLGQVIEGSAAVGLAAVLAGKIDTGEQPTGALITGGNIDPALHRQLTARFPRDTWQVAGP